MRQSQRPGAMSLTSTATTRQAIAVRQVALLRGVNLGPSRRVSMPELRELLERAGFENVQTYVQSGNVVLTSTLTPDSLAKRLEWELADGLGLETQVLVRTQAELAKIVERDPLGREADNPARYQVTFLDKPLAAAKKRELEAADVAPERVVVHGREIYAWHPDGQARSRLAALLTASKLGRAASARNWRTVTKLLELAG